MPLTETQLQGLVSTTVRVVRGAYRSPSPMAEGPVMAEVLSILVGQFKTEHGL